MGGVTLLMAGRGKDMWMIPFEVPGSVEKYEISEYQFLRVKPREWRPSYRYHGLLPKMGGKKSHGSAPVLERSLSGLYQVREMYNTKGLVGRLRTDPSRRKQCMF